MRRLLLPLILGVALLLCSAAPATAETVAWWEYRIYFYNSKVGTKTLVEGYVWVDKITYLGKPTYVVKYNVTLVNKYVVYNDYYWFRVALEDANPVISIVESNDGYWVYFNWSAWGESRYCLVAYPNIQVLDYVVNEPGFQHITARTLLCSCDSGDDAPPCQTSYTDELGRTYQDYHVILTLAVFVPGRLYNATAAKIEPVTVTVNWNTPNLTRLTVNYGSNATAVTVTPILTSTCTCSNWTYVITNQTPEWLWYSVSVSNPDFTLWWGIRNTTHPIVCEVHYSVASLEPTPDYPVPEPVVDVLSRPRPYYDFVFEQPLSGYLVAGWKSGTQKEIAASTYHHYLVIYTGNCTAIVLYIGSVEVGEALSNVPWYARPLVRAVLYVIDAMKTAVLSIVPEPVKQFIASIGKMAALMLDMLMKMLPWMPLFLFAYVLVAIHDPNRFFWQLLEDARRLIKTIIEILKP